MCMWARIILAFLEAKIRKGSDGVGWIFLKMTRVKFKGYHLKIRWKKKKISIQILFYVVGF